MPPNWTSDADHTCAQLMILGALTKPILKSKVSGSICKRAVDSLGNTLEFMLSAKRDTRAAERFLRKALKSTHNQEPRVINVDKNAVYPPAIDELKADQYLPKTTELRRVKYLNNIRLLAKVVDSVRKVGCRVRSIYDLFAV